jgi:hypothetical protein
VARAVLACGTAHRASRLCVPPRRAASARPTAAGLARPAAECIPARGEVVVPPPPSSIKGTAQRRFTYDRAFFGGGEVGTRGAAAAALSARRPCCAPPPLPSNPHFSCLRAIRRRVRLDVDAGRAV